MNSHRNTKRASLSSSAAFWLMSNKPEIHPLPLRLCLDPTIRSFPTHLDTSNRFLLSLPTISHNVHGAICTIPASGFSVSSGVHSRSLSSPPASHERGGTGDRCLQPLICRLGQSPPNHLRGALLAELMAYLKALVERPWPKRFPCFILPI